MAFNAKIVTVPLPIVSHLPPSTFAIDGIQRLIECRGIPIIERRRKVSKVGRPLANFAVFPLSVFRDLFRNGFLNIGDLFLVVVIAAGDSVGIVEAETGLAIPRWVGDIRVT